MMNTKPMPQRPVMQAPVAHTPVPVQAIPSNAYGVDKGELGKSWGEMFGPSTAGGAAPGAGGAVFGAGGAAPGVAGNMPVNPIKATGTPAQTLAGGMGGAGMDMLF